MFLTVRKIALCVLAITFVFQSGCDPVGPNIGSGDGFGNAGGYTQTNSGNRIYGPQGVPRIAMGSFNIKSFGMTKMSNPNVVSILTDIVRRFDIIAIQELRDKDQGVIPEFLRYINANGANYAAAVGPRQGYTSGGRETTYFEQTVFIYNADLVELIGPTYAAYDRHEIMYRPPFIGHFRCLGVPPEQAFTFVLMNVHVAPKRAHEEFEALQEIIGGVYANHQGEDDFILLGDLNDEPDKYQRYQWMRNQYPALPSEWKTNTVQTEAYDNIVFDAGYTAEFTNQSGVLNLMDEYRLTLPQAQLVSDHMPVWAVFSVLEAPAANITQGNPEAVIR